VAKWIYFFSHREECAGSQVSSRITCRRIIHRSSLIFPPVAGKFSDLHPWCLYLILSNFQVYDMSDLKFQYMHLANEYLRVAGYIMRWGQPGGALA
jgi:hypothetical protein